MNPLYVYFIIFFCIGYLIVTDASVARLFVLLTELARIQYQRVKWWILYNPSNPIVKWLMYRKFMKMAEELMKEFEGRDK
jgi:ribosome-associated toxin RatA of RatAB toxin-antitoxin module